ncbi:PadR family transcriptional regulator [Herbiconiux liangxiaofengii]|uniref:PadR family transcriptional regulator n=1 Tax=Herbiconiux liangxiaofengii TaxID=3342795 RepID=UPI0035B792D7
MQPLQRVTAPTVDVLSAMLDGSGPIWGLRIVKESGRPSGTVYPILDRLERQGWIESTWEELGGRESPPRRLYEFTDEGREAARDLRSSFAERHRP